jgi:hygromycin-B 4-O-kinase
MKLIIDEVLKFLEDHTQKSVDAVTPVGNGEWSQAFYYQETGVDKVIRFNAIDDDFKRDKFASCFNSRNLPIPEIEEIGTAFDGYFAISKKVDGVMIDHLGAEEIKKIVPGFLDLLDSMRMIDTSKTTGFGGWNTEGNGTRNSWRDFLTNKVTRERIVNNDSLKTFDLAYEELLKLISFCPEDRHVVHNDLLHFNLLVKDNKVTGVIDWGCALYGDYLYDLAMYITWQFYYPAMAGIDFKEEARKYFEKRGADISHFDERLKCYQLHLFLDSMAYNSYKENWKNVEMVSNRLVEIMKH